MMTIVLARARARAHHSFPRDQLGGRGTEGTREQGQREEEGEGVDEEMNDAAKSSKFEF